jgi:hypothetical protein
MRQSSAPAKITTVEVPPITVQTPGTQTVIVGGDRSPQAIYRALRDQREILGEQLRTAQRTRDDLVRQIRESGGNDASRVGLEKRIANVDARIAEIDKQIAVSDAAVATAAAVPGATVRPPVQRQTEPDPDLIVGLSFMTLMIVAIPITIAYARRIWRRSARTEVTLPPEMRDRMESLERGVEAIALEVERIGEGQRFLTSAMTDRIEARPRPDRAGEPQPAYLRPGEKVEQRR